MTRKMPNPAYRRLSQEITTAIRHSPFTQKAIAKYIGVSVSCVSDWATGRSAPNALLLVRLEVACGIPRGTILMRLRLLDVALLKEDDGGD